jgi:hypothetical protein
MADLSHTADKPPFDEIIRDGFGKAHGEAEGSAPYNTDSLTGGSETPEPKGFSENKNGVGMAK